MDDAISKYLHTGNVRLFNIVNLSKVLKNYKEVKSKHMILSITAGKAIIKLQCYFMIQTLKKVGIKGCLFNMKKSSMQSHSKHHAQC